MIFGSVNMSSPLSLYSIPVVWFTGFYPSTLKFLSIDRAIGYNNVQPRSAANDPRLSKEHAQRVERMIGAHNNGTENAPLWYAAIIAGHIAGLDNKWLNTMSAYYIVTRVLYNQVYINHNGIAKGWLRTALFFLGLSFPLQILIKAGQKIAGHD